MFELNTHLTASSMCGPSSDCQIFGNVQFQEYKWRAIKWISISCCISSYIKNIRYAYYHDIVHILRSSYITEFCMQMSAASWRSNFALQPPCRMPPSKKRPGIGMWPAAACRQAMKPRPSPSPLCPKFIAKKYFAVFCCILAWCLCLEDTTQPQLTHWHLEGQWQSCELLSYLLPSRTLEKDWCPIANQQTNHSRLRSQPTKMLREIETPAMRIWKAMSKKRKYHCSKLTPSPVVVRCAQSGGT